MFVVFLLLRDVLTQTGERPGPAETRTRPGPGLTHTAQITGLLSGVCWTQFIRFDLKQLILWVVFFGAPGV